jgi:hypothetical protein
VSKINQKHIQSKLAYISTSACSDLQLPGFRSTDVVKRFKVIHFTTLCRKSISLIWTWPAENYNACQITTNKTIYNHVVVKAPTDLE